MTGVVLFLTAEQDVDTLGSSLVVPQHRVSAWERKAAALRVVRDSTLATCSRSSIADHGHVPFL